MARVTLAEWRKQQLSRRRYPREAYMKALPFLYNLRACKSYLTTTQLSELRDQALRGDIDGAEWMLRRMLMGRA